MLRPLLLSLMLSVFASPAFAQSSLVSAEKAFDSLEFDKAASLFKQALSQPGTQSERVRAYRGLGLSQAFMGEARAARVSFERLLMVDPNATVDAALGPKITGPFEAARKGGKRGQLSYDRNASTGEVTVKVKEDLPLTHEVQVYVRTEGLDRFNPVSGPPSEPLTVSTDPSVSTDIYMQAVDVNDGVLYTVGSSSKPLHFAPRGRKVAQSGDLDALDLKASSEPKASSGVKWPIWVGVGVGAAAALGVGIYFIASANKPLDLPQADRTSRLPGVSF